MFHCRYGYSCISFAHGGVFSSKPPTMVTTSCPFGTRSRVSAVGIVTTSAGTQSSSSKAAPQSGQKPGGGGGGVAVPLAGVVGGDATPPVGKSEDRDALRSCGERS